ncbi:IS110 family transposase [Rhodococcus daqingensis]|uniref:Transposase n=1 Tax=Rhodococcus daqingensis TaxID=2479363 RepID=A0ABW2S540_9NOCA
MEFASVIVFGIDPHKSTHTATAVDSTTNTDLGSIRINASFDDYAQLMTWSKQRPDRIWAVENASGLGHHLTQWLISRGEAVVDVPSTATARVRELSRGGRRKNDRIDAAAAAAACVAFSQGDFRPVAPEGHTDVLRILDERRTDLVKQNGRLVNQLHAVLRELFPGGIERDFATEDAAAQLGLWTVTRGHDGNIGVHWRPVEARYASKWCGPTLPSSTRTKSQRPGVRTIRRLTAHTGTFRIDRGGEAPLSGIPGSRSEDYSPSRSSAYTTIASR